MLKKLVSSFILLAMLLMFSAPCFAGNLINITRPEGSEETIYKRSYVIAGNTNKEGVVIELSVLDGKTNTYIPFKNCDGEAHWEIGISSMFMKEIPLDNVGTYRFKVTAYQKANPEYSESVKFSITVMNKNLKDKIVNGFSNVTDYVKTSFNSIFNND